jgi:hypothetical protein
MAKKCPSCGKQTRGRFCSHCGTALEAPQPCQACGNEIPVGGRFCNMCGIPVAAAPPPDAAPAGAGGASRLPRGSNVAWYVAGAALLALVVAIVAPRFTTPGPGANLPAPPITGPAPTGAAAVDLSTMTPREAADRLFNRVMEGVSVGDTAQARGFLPMALAAYDRVGTLDLDGHYHVAVLHLVNEDAPAARAEADVILQEVPTHLFGLFTAAQAEEMRGNESEANELYRRFLANYETEVALARPEYLEHPQVLPSMRAEATDRVGSS